MNRQPVEFSAANFVALLCTAAIGVAFFTMPWMSLLGTGVTGMQLIATTQNLISYESIYGEALTSRWSFMSSILWLIPAAVIISLSAIVFGMVNASARKATEIVVCVAGGIGLIPYVLLFAINIPNLPNLMAAAGPGFWIGLLATLGLISHIFIPRTMVVTFSVIQISSGAASKVPQQHPQDILTDARLSPVDSDSSLPEPLPLPPDHPAIIATGRARGFSGKRNRDWDPCVMNFPDLKIPDMPFCLVPVGGFVRGSDEGRGDEQPAHWQVIKQAFWIAQHPVTNTQWRRAVMASAVPLPRGDEALGWYHDPTMGAAPVVGVGWYMARAFADWLGCRLPSELEWEYAARGVESLRYPWGQDWKTEFAVWRENSGSKPDAVTAHAAGASWVGALHMSGNVWEWTSSVYGLYPYTTVVEHETDSDKGRVLRGGSLANASNGLRASRRGWLNPRIDDGTVGLRCVRAFVG